MFVTLKPTDREGAYCVRIEEIVGGNMRARRTELGRSQDSVAKAVGEQLGREWTRQAVSAAEKGRRAFTIAELAAIAHVLVTNIPQLLTPPSGVGSVEVGEGQAMDRAWFMGAVLPAIGTGFSREALDEAISDLAVHIPELQRVTDLVGNDIERVNENVAELASRALGAQRQQPSQREEPAPVSIPERPPVVTAIVTSPLGVLVGQRHDGKPPWTFIAGEQDAVQDESPADTAVRELKEETGLRVEVGEEIGRRVHPKTGRTMIYMAARPTHGTDIFVGDEEELAQVRWVSLAEADELMASYGMFEPVHDYLSREIGG